jgi:hypothetical protein
MFWGMIKIDKVNYYNNSSFSAHWENQCYQGIRHDGNIVLLKRKIYEVSLSVEYLEYDSDNQLEQGSFLLFKYSSDIFLARELDLFFEKFFKGYNAEICQDDLDKLLRLLENLSVKRKSLVGLAGELLFIYNSSDFNRSVEAWHISANSVFDFSFDSHIVEVKSSASNIRVHKLNYVQHGKLKSIDFVDTFYCSVLIDKNRKDTSLSDLIEQIRIKLKNDKMILFNEKLTPYEFLVNSDWKFGLESSLKSIKTYSLDKMSYFINVEPEVITDRLSFNVDFSYLE